MEKNKFGNIFGKWVGYSERSRQHENIKKIGLYREFQETWEYQENEIFNLQKKCTNCHKIYIFEKHLTPRI